MNTGQKVGLVIGGVAGGGLLAYLLLRMAKGAAGNYQFTLSASTNPVTVGQTDTITAQLLYNNQPLQNVQINLEDVTNPNAPQTIATQTTDSTGTATFSVSFTNAGTYSLQASANV
jgi:hypothetical protein